MRKCTSGSIVMEDYFQMEELMLRLVHLAPKVDKALPSTDLTTRLTFQQLVNDVLRHLSV